MNAIFTSIFQAIPSMVLQVEKAITAPGSGAEKAAAVTGVVAQALPVGDSEGMAKAKQVMEFSVWALNTFGPLFFKSGTPSEPVAIAAVPAE